MTIVYLNYFYSKKYDKPEDWLAKMQPINVVLEELAKKHTVISVQQIDYHGSLVKNAVDYRFTNLYNKKTFLTFRLNQLVKQLKPDAIIIHGTVFPLQTILLRLIVGKSVTLVVQHHAELPFKGIKKVVQKIASYFVDAYFFPAKETGELWQKLGNLDTSKPVFNIHEGASAIQKIDRATARLFTKANGHPTYIWVGRLDTNKQPLLAIKSFARFLKKVPTAKLYMLFYQDELLDEVTNYLSESLLLNTQIVLVGKVPYQEMSTWYTSIDFYISSSYKEGTSFTLSEAMSCGCVPIVSNIPTHVEMLGSNCGFLYEAGNENALLEALVASVEISFDAEKQKVLQRYQQHLSPTAIANNIEQAFTQLQ